MRMCLLRLNMLSNDYFHSLIPGQFLFSNTTQARCQQNVVCSLHATLNSKKLTNAL